MFALRRTFLPRSPDHAIAGSRDDQPTSAEAHRPTRADSLQLPLLQTAQHSAYQSTSDLVLRPHLPVHVLVSCLGHAEAVGEDSRGQNRRRQELKESGEKFDRETGIREQLPQRLPAIAPKMAGVEVL